ncbi:hypothetical protein A1507_00245 [Methylomonas koyamae]|uniref:DUF4266 domain-containing protein n=1 Tax=Methylomonas koyamae TaxID=702114 RepID=A0A177NP80_9GAMM|nr:hypothetical protein A1507_00245 [Methylomonas koyamae]
MPVKNRAGFIALIGLAVCSGVSGCAPVQPWERGILAKPQMAITANPMSDEMRGHIYGSREAGAGSNTAKGGGGCGCY